MRAFLVAVSHITQDFSGFFRIFPENSVAGTPRLMFTTQSLIYRSYLLVSGSQLEPNALSNSLW
jgi:hypothetical protein